MTSAGEGGASGCRPSSFWTQGRRVPPTRLLSECEPWHGVGMNLPTLVAQAGFAATIIEWWPVLAGFVGLVLVCGETRAHVSGLREWKREAQAEIAALKSTVTALGGRADLQDQRMNHILSLLEELRADVKRLLERKDAA